MIELSDQDRRAMFNELLDVAGTARPQREGQFTIMEFADEMGMTRERAASLLERLWKSGELEREKVLASVGRIAYAYWRVEPDNGD